MIVTTPSGHHIEVNNLDLLGREKVHYDGKMMSNRFSVAGGTYIFEVDENNESIQYEVQFGTKWHGGCFHVMRRNGRIFFSNR